MTVDTSNPNKLPWGEMPREVRAEILMQWCKGKVVQLLQVNGKWLDAAREPDWFFMCIYRIKPEEKRETVTLREWLSDKNPFGRPLIADMIEIETVNGGIDKSVQPRWVE